MSSPPPVDEFVERKLLQPPEYLFLQAERFERIIRDMRLYTRLHNQTMSRLIAACEEDGWTLLEDRVEPSASVHRAKCADYQHITDTSSYVALTWTA